MTIEDMFGPPFDADCPVCMGYGRVCLCWYDKEHGSGKGVHHGHTPTDDDPTCETCGGTGRREGVEE